MLITRDARQAAALGERSIAEFGAQPIFTPVLQIAPAADTAPLENAIDELARFDWIVFTSVNGVEAFMRHLLAKYLDARALGHARLCAIGPATAERLAKYHLRADCVPEKYLSTEIAEALQKIEPMSNKRLLLPRADIAPPALATDLQALGATVKEVTAYRTVTEPFDAEDLAAQLRTGALDVVTLMSSSAARFLAEGLGAENIAAISESVVFAAIGPVTAQTARKYGLPIDIEAQEHTAEGLVQAVLEYYRG